MKTFKRIQENGQMNSQRKNLFFLSNEFIDFLECIRIFIIFFTFFNNFLNILKFSGTRFHITHKNFPGD